MFAPWCPTCARRTLLGPRRVEAVEPGPTGPRVVLRCFCETLLVWSAAAEAPPAPAPAVDPVAGRPWSEDGTPGHAAAVRGW
ncbi:hypothetical protein KSP35_18165 [Aquihabitans sp. G128]|uniref:hypothetical protein n=1 Tax=Aquihabitans sp. G128 TaxID=2849779 RepID=UPI001C24767E|nr:hypothetical protein [Aquihabitans sp. G128]QXC60248.1 hypothetical protein KSP35_18165 [Aquihabitans sp. G128]